MRTFTRWAAGALCLALAATACGNGSEGTIDTATTAPPSSEEASTTAATEGPGSVTVGNLQSLTGPAASFGETMTQGAELAVDTFNARGGLQVEMPTQDDETDPTRATTAMLQLIDAEGAVAILGPTASSIAVALESIAADRKIPLMAPFVSTPDYGTPDGYAFRPRMPVQASEERTAQYAIDELGCADVGALIQNSSDGLAALEAITPLYEAAGGSVTTEFVEPGQTEFRSQVNKLVSGNPDCMYIFVIDPSILGGVVQQSRSQGFTGKFTTIITAQRPEFLEIAGDLAEDVIWTTEVVPDDTDADYVEFVDRYEERYGSPPDITAANAYDGMMLLLEAIESVGTDGTAIRDWLYTVSDYNGVSGTITIDERGNATGKPTSVFGVADGEFVVLDTRP